MEVTLNDGRRATFIRKVSDKIALIRINSGEITREMTYPMEKIKFPDEPHREKNDQAGPEEPEFKITYSPAIDRLEEFCKDLERLDRMRGLIPLSGGSLTETEQKLFSELWEEAKREHQRKWGV